ncbi:hypothetical protein IWZ03DRAFT_357003 [Phyllosticta citriasiana]|uniref:C2H2-type domain-containing protein n=1 Tax=Phyllosticta citriasiana TaxID=595635 RepID=A0ABR1L178_9PEZI
MPCPNHNHVWPTSGELMVWHCELQCGFCPAKNFKQSSHLRAHAKIHQREYRQLKVLPGKLGNAGKYETERHKPRRKKTEQHAEGTAQSSSGSRISKEGYPKQIPLPRAPAHLAEQPVGANTFLNIAASNKEPEQCSQACFSQTAVSQGLAFVNSTVGSNAAMGSDATGAAAVDNVSPAESQFSGHHSAPLCRDTSFAGPSMASVAGSSSGFSHAPVQQSNVYYEPFTGVDPFCLENVDLSGCGPNEHSVTLPIRQGSTSPTVLEPQHEEFSPSFFNVHGENTATQEYPMLPQALLTDIPDFFTPIDGSQPIMQSTLPQAEILPTENAASSDFDPSFGESIFEPFFMERPDPTQPQGLYEESPATNEALVTLDCKMDEILDLVARAQGNGANVDVLKARAFQRVKNIGKSSEVGMDLSSMQ